MGTTAFHGLCQCLGVYTVGIRLAPHSGSQSWGVGTGVKGSWPMSQSLGHKVQSTSSSVLRGPAQLAQLVGNPRLRGPCGAGKWLQALPLDTRLPGRMTAPTVFSCLPFKYQIYSESEPIIPVRKNAARGRHQHDILRRFLSSVVPYSWSHPHQTLYPQPTGNSGACQVSHPGLLIYKSMGTNVLS